MQVSENIQNKRIRAEEADIPKTAKNPAILDTLLFFLFSYLHVKRSKINRLENMSASSNPLTASSLSMSAVLSQLVNRL